MATIRTAPAGGTEADLLRRRPRFPLEWDGGYYASLGLMAAITFFGFLYFRRKDWL